MKRSGAFRTKVPLTDWTLDRLRSKSVCHPCEKQVDRSQLRSTGKPNAPLLHRRSARASRAFYRTSIRARFRLCLHEFGARAAISRAKHQARSWQNSSVSISRSRQMRGQTKCSRFFTRIFSTRCADDDWQQNRRRHQSRDLPNGDCPTCDSYDARFAKLLIQTLPTAPRGLKQGNTQFQFEFQYPSRVTTMHHIQ